MIGYLDEVIRSLVLILPKMIGYVKTFKGNLDKNKNKKNKLMSFRIGDDKLLEKYKIIWTQIKALQNIELNTLLAYHDRYIKTK